jgi:hypothetical protein
MFDRIFKNWRTTALGTTVIIASLLLVYFEKATLTEAGAFIVAGLGFIFAKDESKTSKV